MTGAHDMKAFMRIVTLTFAAAALAGCSAFGPDRDTLYQVSAFDAFAKGAYEGQVTVASLKAHGDVGTGTLNSLDGEMVCLRGAVYRVGADGAVSPVSDAARTPFACVTFFEPDRSVTLPEGTSLDQLAAYLTEQAGSRSLPLAVRLSGTFSYVKARSVPAQSPPYPPLEVVARNQPVFEFAEARGTMVGFWVPPYLNGTCFPGMHLHFLTADGRGGGHVLEFTAKEGVAQVDVTPRVCVVGADGADFLKADFSAAQPRPGVE